MASSPCGEVTAFVRRTRGTARFRQGRCNLPQIWLEARIEIREVLDRYHAAVNLRDWQLLGTLFAQDAVWEVGPPASLHFAGRERVVSEIQKSVLRQEFLVQSNFAVVIDLKSHDTATARSTIIEFGREPNGGKGMQVVGFYDDELARIDGAWKYVRHTMRVRYMNDAPLPGTLSDERYEPGP